MIIPCEMAVKAIVPTIRAMVAKELSASYRMKQSDIASVMGITQSAVSQYLGNVRGKTLDIEGVKEIDVTIKDIAYILATDTSEPKHIFRKYCEICRIVRERKMLCQLHRHLDPAFNIEGCDRCTPSSAPCL